MGLRQVKPGHDEGYLRVILSGIWYKPIMERDGQKGVTGLLGALDQIRKSAAL
jgi:hypothetical protein